MKRSSKLSSCSYGNKDLMQWLLKIGPTRQILLKKLRTTLSNLGVPEPTVRKGLLQLVSRPTVQLNRLAATQIRRKKNRMRGPKSKRYPRPMSCSVEEEVPLQLDTNNNDSGISQQLNSTSSTSCSWEKQHNSSSEVAAERKKHRREKSKTREGRSTSRSESRSKTEKHSGKIDPGEELNSIQWRLTQVEMTDPPSNYGSQIRIKQRLTKAKKDRLLAKFKEIFGDDDQELDEITPTVENCNSSEETEINDYNNQATFRQSPIFTSKKRKSRCDRLKSKPKKSKPQTPEDCHESDSTVVQETPAAHCRVSKIRRISQSTDSSSESVEAKSDTTTTLPNADKVTSDSSSDWGREKHDKGSIPESEPESSAESPQEVETTNSDLLDENLPQAPAPPQTRVCLKHERIDPPLDEFEERQPLVPKQEDPSSTTDALPPAVHPCNNNRLLGALDKIFMAMHCRRRVDEREKTANKLAIKQNRQDALLEAHRELKIKMYAFREELLYLYNELETRDSVLKFILQGLNDRTSSDIRPFTESEIEAAMKDTDVKICFNKSKQKVESPQPDTGAQIICEIDLTEDSEMIDLCDSSTDPPKRSIKNEAYHSKANTDNEVEDVLILDDLPTPSIAEVRSISPQQFETIDREKVVPPISEDICLCFVCSMPSSVACGLCGKAYYCSKACQECHWAQGHHETCIPSEAVIRFTR